MARNARPSSPVATNVLSAHKSKNVSFSKIKVWMKSPVHDIRRAMIVPPAHEVINSVHFFPASLLNSRRPSITSEYILRSASTGGGRMERFPPFNGDNDEHQVQSAAWADSWEGKERASLGMKLGFMQRWFKQHGSFGTLIAAFP